MDDWAPSAVWSASRSSVWHGFPLMTAVCNVEPGRFGSHENMATRRGTRRLVQTAHRNVVDAAICAGARYRRSAGLAEGVAEELGVRMRIVRDLMLTSRPMQLISRHKRIGGVRGPFYLAASAAVAIHRKSRFAGKFESDSAAETAAGNHPRLWLG